MVDLICVYAIFAGVFVFGKKAVLNSDPFFLTAVRLIPAGFLLVVFSRLLRESLPKIKRKTIPLFAGLALFYFLMDAFRFISLKYVPASHAALLSSLTPFITALVAHLMFKEVFPFKKLAALFLGLVAVLPLMIQNLQRSTAPSAETSFQVVTGYAAMLVCVLSIVFAVFLLKEILEKEKYPVIFSMGTALFFGGCASCIVSFFLEPWNPLPLRNPQETVPLILFIFVTHNMISQPLYGYLVRKYPVTLVTFASLVTPITSAILSFFLYDQPIGYTFTFSVVTLAAAFFLFYHEEKKEGLIH